MAGHGACGLEGDGGRAGLLRSLDVGPRVWRTSVNSLEPVRPRRKRSPLERRRGFVTRPLLSGHCPALEGKGKPLAVGSGDHGTTEHGSTRTRVERRVRPARQAPLRGAGLACQSRREHLARDPASEGLLPTGGPVAQAGARARSQPAPQGDPSPAPAGPTTSPLLSQRPRRAGSAGRVLLCRSLHSA